MLRDVFAECVRVLEPGGRIAVNVANLGRKPYRSLAGDVTTILQDELALLLRGEIIWRKAKGASGSCAFGSYLKASNPVHARRHRACHRRVEGPVQPGDRAEAASRRWACPYEYTIAKEEFFAAALDVWEIRPESARRVEHPAPFPVELPERLIQLPHLRRRRRARPVPRLGLHRDRGGPQRAALRRVRHRPDLHRHRRRAHRARRHRPPPDAGCSASAHHRVGPYDWVLVSALAANVNSNLYLLTAFGGGVISFLSPCVLPMVPGYLSLVTGLSVGEIQEGNNPHYLKRIAINTGMFVLGFTVVFVLLGLLTTSLGNALFTNQETLTRISGGLVLLMACYLAGSQILTTPSLYQEVRFHPHLERFGPVAAPVAGAAFGLGWQPCIGPVLGAVLGFAAVGDNIARAPRCSSSPTRSGSGCRSSWSGLAMGKLTRTLNWFKRHSRAITFVSAGILAIFGIILLTDQLQPVTARIIEGLRDNGFSWLVDAG